MNKRKTVILGILGTTLDRGSTPERWNRWRPTISACQHPDLLVDRYDLLCDPAHTGLRKTITRDINQVSPETEVVPHDLALKNPWDFGEVYAALHEFAAGYPFDPDNEDYLIQITTGTHVAQICLFLLTEARHMPGQLLQISPPKRWRDGGPGTYDIIDLDLSRRQLPQDDRPGGRHNVTRTAAEVRCRRIGTRWAVDIAVRHGNGSDNIEIGITRQF